VFRKLSAIWVLVGMCGAGLAAEERLAPEPTGGSSMGVVSSAKRELVVAANPYAARAGARILADGGSAIDAAIAAQLVLNLVEPQSSGIGGGAFLLYFDAAAKSLVSYDGRETAPAGATPGMFLRADGTVPGYIEALEGGRGVGVPGLLRMLEMAHEVSGKLPWSHLFEPAVELADGGFTVSARLNALVSKVPTLARSGSAADYFFDDGGLAKTVGAQLINKKFAETLRIISGSGSKGFYEGPIANDIVAMVQNDPINPGKINLDDFARYEAKRRLPVCLGYNGFDVCGVGPPSSGGLAVLQILGLVERLQIKDLERWSPEAVHLFMEASRIAFADRNRYVADPDFVDVPVSGLLDETYLNGRAKLIDRTRVAAEVFPGSPPGLMSSFDGDDNSSEKVSTTHLSVVDRWGNVASMTSSIEFAFGSAIMVRGFLLNNQLTDFSFNPIRDGKTVANGVWPGKRPRSSMSPMIVFDSEGDPLLAIGSPGGSRIICYVAKVLIDVLDWGTNIGAAISDGNLCNRGAVSEIESGSAFLEMKAVLEEMGHNVKVADMNSGLHGIIRVEGKLLGAADPRREGYVSGR